MNKFLKWALWLVAVAGMLLGADYAYGYWVWSSAAPGNPDLSRGITFEGRTGGIFVSRLDGNDKKEITESLNLGPDDYTWLPRFSPDGKKIAFATGHLNREEKMSWDVRILVWDSAVNSVKEIYKSNIPATSEFDLPFVAKFYTFWSLNGLKLGYLDETDTSDKAVVYSLSTGENSFFDEAEDDLYQSDKSVEDRGAPREPAPKWIAWDTYRMSGEFGSFGQNVVYIKPKYSIFKKKILTEYPYYNGVWLDENHIIVDGPRDIIVVDIKGSVKARIPDARHFDLAP